jgi:hypothetical protein
MPVSPEFPLARYMWAQELTSGLTTSGNQKDP